MRTFEAALDAFNACSKLRRAEIEAIAEEENPDEIWIKDPPPPEPEMTARDWEEFDAFCDAEDARAHEMDESTRDVEPEFRHLQAPRVNPHD